MASNTNNTSDDEFGVTDDTLMGPTAKTEADVRSAEEMLVQKLLGVDLRAVKNGRPLDIAVSVLQNVSSVVISTRGQVQGLFAPLRRSIQEKMNQVQAVNTGEEQVRGVAAVVAEAVRETFPAEVVRELTERVWPTVYRADQQTRNIGVDLRPSDLIFENVRIVGDPPIDPMGREVTVVVDTDHPFWKKDNAINIDTLRAQLTGCSIQSVGIRIVPDVMGPGTVLRDDDVGRILSGVSTEMYVLDTNTEDPTIRNYGANNFTVRLKVRQLIAENSHQDVAFANNIALRNFLFNPNNWNRFVEVVPTDRTPNGAAVPIHTDTALLNQLADEAYRLVFGATVPLNIASGQMNLREVARQQHALHQFSHGLRNGDVNAWDVASAMTMIQQDGSLADNIVANNNADAINAARNNLDLRRAIAQLAGMNIQAVVGASADSMSHYQDQLARVNRDMTLLSHATPTFTSEFFSGHSSTSPISSGDRITLQRLMQEKAKELSKAVGELGSLQNTLIRIQPILIATGGVPGSFPPLTPPGSITATTNTAQIARDVEQGRANLREEQFYIDEIKRLQDAAGDAPTGPQAIHNIYQAYFQRRGLSHIECRNAANELMARNAIDQEMDGIISNVAQEIWSEDEAQGAIGEEWWRRMGWKLATADVTGVVNWNTNSEVLDRIRTIARAFTVPLTNNQPNYEAATPDNLIRCYYALKGRIGSGGALGFMENDPNIHAAMRTMSQTIARSHVKRLLYMFKGSLPGEVDEKDEQIEALMSQPQKLGEVVKQLLAGDAPDSEKDYMKKRMDFAERRHAPVRSFTRQVLGRVWQAGSAQVASDKWPFSFKNLYYNYPKKVLSSASSAASATGKAVWGERGNIAKGALIGTLVFPFVGTAIGAGVGGMWRKMKG